MNGYNNIKIVVYTIDGFKDQQLAPKIQINSINHWIIAMWGLKQLHKVVDMRH